MNRMMFSCACSTIATLMLLTTACVYAGEQAEKPIPDFAKDLMGCWQLDTDAGVKRNFELGRCILLHEGKILFYSAVYEPGTFKVSQAGSTRKYIAKFSVNAGILTIIWKDNETEHYRKLDTVPDEMQTRPLAFGAQSSIAPEKVKEIQNEMAQRFKTDQSVRTDPKRESEMQRIDADNTAYVMKVVKEFGWIDVGRFGNEASTTAFLIVQHSGQLPLMLAALPEIEKDFKSGRLKDAQPYALLYDRLKVDTCQKQRYGSQIGQEEDGTPFVFPLEDRVNLDKLRKEIGMAPMAQYLWLFELRAGKKAKFADE